VSGCARSESVKSPMRAFRFSVATSPLDLTHVFATSKQNCPKKRYCSDSFSDLLDHLQRIGHVHHQPAVANEHLGLAPERRGVAKTEDRRASTRAARLHRCVMFSSMPTEGGWWVFWSSPTVQLSEIVPICYSVGPSGRRPIPRHPSPPGSEEPNVPRQ
jgi:hypothetical protein